MSKYLIKQFNAQLAGQQPGLVMSDQYLISDPKWAPNVWGPVVENAYMFATDNDAKQGIISVMARDPTLVLRCGFVDYASECRYINQLNAPIEHVNHPQHYGGADNPYEAIKVIEAWDLNFCLGNTVKYISRAGKKDGDKWIEDLQKAAWYLNRHIDNLIKLRNEIRDRK